MIELSYEWSLIIPFISVNWLGFTYLYIKDRDNKKLMFSVSFFTTLISYIYLTLGYSNLESGLIGLNIYQWTSIPFTIAVFIAANEIFLKKKNFSFLFMIFLAFYVFSSLMIFVPVDFSPYLAGFKLFVQFEIILISLYLMFKIKDFSYILFLLSMICFLISSMSMTFEVVYLPIFSSILAYIFIVLIFIYPACSASNLGIGSYFSLKKRLELTELNLKETEENLAIFKKFAETANLGFGWSDLNGKIKYINPALCRMLGGKKEKDFHGKNISNYYTNEDKITLDKNILLEVKKNSKWTGEISLKSTKGKTTPAIQNIFLIKDDDNSPLYYAGVITDITDQKKFAESLKESEEKYKNLIEKSPDSILILNMNGVVTSCNTATEFISGYTKDEFIGKHFIKLGLFDTKDILKYSRYIKNIIKNHDLTPFEVKFNHKDGSPRFIEIHPAFINKDGKKVGIQAVSRDITERKKAELKEKKHVENSLFLSYSAIELTQFPIEGDIYRYLANKLHKLQKNAYIIISDYNDESKSFSIKNIAGCGNYTKKITKLLGGDPISMEMNIISSKWIKKLNTGKIIKLPKDEVKKLIISQVTKNIKPVFEKFINIDEVYTVGLAKEDKLIGNVLIVAHNNHKIQNIATIETFINQAAVAIQRNQAMKKLTDLNLELEGKVKDRTYEVEKLLHQKDEFINQLGHDLKNPINPITNLLPVLEQNEQDPKKKELFNIIDRNVDYMKNLIVKTIALARLNSPNTTFSIEDINASDEIKDILEKNKLIFEKNNIQYKNKIPNDLIIQVDKLRFEELIDNLITNAVKYSYDKGEIIIDGKKDNSFVILSIKDNGIGMNEEQKSHIFDEFYKADKSRHDFKSSGLGLSICKRIIEKHGGKIWVESSGLKKGSCFYFTFPYNKPVEMKNKLFVEAK